MIDAEEVASAKTLRAPRHLLDGHATDGSSGDERSDTRTRVDGRADLPLLERAKDADVCKSFHAAATKYERDALATAAVALLYHRRMPGFINSSGS
jgi:hypothetical protein